MTVTEKTRAARERVGPAADAAREAVGATAETVREGAGTAAKVVRESADTAADVARAAADTTAHVVRDAVGTTAAVARDAAEVTVDTARELAEQVPGIVARIISAISAFLRLAGSRSREVTGDLGDRGRALAASIDPPKNVRRKRRAKTIAWAGGGFAVGFLAGWIVHERTADQDFDDELWAPPSAEDDTPDPVPPAPDLIDARSGNGRN